MLFSSFNFLAHIKNLITGGGMAHSGVDSPRHDCGFWVDKPATLEDLSTDTAAVTITDSTGGTPSATFAAITAPGANATTSLTADMTAVKNALSEIAGQLNAINAQVNLTAAETNLRVLSLAASTTAIGTLNFVVPRDYDENTDIFGLKVIAASAGATDTPVLTATVYRKRLGANIATVGTFTGSQALTALAANVNFYAISKGLQRDDVLTIVLTAAAHTTDAVLVYGIEPSYRSTLVSYHEKDAAKNPLR